MVAIDQGHDPLVARILSYLASLASDQAELVEAVQSLSALSEQEIDEYLKDEGF
jgi:hypothetical protein